MNGLKIQYAVSNSIPDTNSAKGPGHEAIKLFMLNLTEHENYHAHKLLAF